MDEYTRYMFKKYIDKRLKFATLCERTCLEIKSGYFSNALSILLKSLEIFYAEKCAYINDFRLILTEL